MGITIDKAILRVEHSSMSIDDKETADFIINTMHKYQKIEQIIKNAKDSDGAVKYNWLYEQIGEVLEDGNDNITSQTKAT